MISDARFGHSGQMGDIGDGPVAPKRTFYQTMVLRDILRRARKHHGEPLSPEDGTVRLVSREGEVGQDRRS